MTRLVVPVATIGVLAIVVTAFAGDRTPRAHHPDQGEAVIRPPASIPTSHAYPRAAASPSSTDRHVAEFLRWKEQHANQPR
jgi:hypothetical protein